ncbi:F-box/LRR-repeat protein 7-like [Schistocerca piceifrons]|uniref:F-box/LRR-repeat protein 7-like n=1 Tax=Schistocerca piceifrons TaxID=274613 RepID=UPI001F5ECE61|nr:F-box/LRR-repeat protein 7-like [Schistocerca piceifrons]
MASGYDHSIGFRMVDEYLALYWSGASPAIPPYFLPSAQKNAGNTYSESNASANNLNSQQSKAAVSCVADSKPPSTGSWQMSIDDFPDEILIKIFSHMSFNELVRVVRKVCPRWKRLSQDSELWADKEYHIGSDTTDKEAIQTFNDVPNLRHVSMQRSATSRVFRALYNGCPKLLELHLHVTQELSYSVLKNLVEKCSKIQKLRISNELLKSEKFSEAVSQLQHLRVLNLEVHFAESTPVLRPLGDGCPQLSEVDFGFSVLDMDDLRYFLNAKRNTLKAICIKCAVVGRKSVLPLLTVCADSLERLQLFYFYIVHDGARQAFTAVGQLKNLKELKMPMLEPLPPGVASLAFTTGGLPKLRVLDLREGFGLDDETLIAISRGCPALRKLIVRNGRLLTDVAFSEIYRLEYLETLDVSGCTGLVGALIPYLTGLHRLQTLIMEDMEFQELQPGLSSIVELTSLRCLTLCYSFVTGVPFDKFPGKLVNLRQLRIRGCQGDPRSIDGLEEQMPNLKIYGNFEADEPSYLMEDHKHDADLAENEENVEPNAADKAQDGTSENDRDSDADSISSSDSESYNNIWDESSISVLFSEDM